MTNSTDATRFNVDATTRQMICEAEAHNLVDALDLLVMGQNGLDDAAIQNELISYAYANRHVDGGASHKALVKVYDAARAAEVVA